MAKANLLVIDDHLRDFELILDILRQQDYQVQASTTGWNALQKIDAEPPDLILCDIEMPGMNGYEVCKQLKNNPRTQDIPVIFISVSDQLLDKVQAFSVGGADYITKPFQIEELLARIRTHLALRELNKELAEKNQELKHEIAKRQEYEQALERMARTDFLTKAINRRHFFELANREIERAQRTNLPIALIMLDIDHFKKINDTHGHLTGDKILHNLAQLCQSKIRETDIFARYGGEEFVVLMPDTNGEFAQKTAERLRQVVFQSFMATGRANVLITISLGVACWDGNTELSLDQLIDKADQALYHAKKAGRNRVSTWDEAKLD
ncbi:MAG TPA: diguanylate cyclase response regulator [Chloroflexi bacterium]|nr:diguanylate cyclase response regulator [Chloroflexota bacterium]HBY08832.1 diguanylate cyclase response regulator [Chloroflexota bacterium]